MNKAIVTFTVPETDKQITIDMTVNGNNCDYQVTTSKSIEEPADDDTDARLLYVLANMFLGAFQGPVPEEVGSEVTTEA